MKDVSISNYRILSLYYSSDIRIYRYLMDTWKHQLRFEKISKETEQKFNDLYLESERIFENISNILKEMDETDSTNELLLLGRFQEQNNMLSRVYKQCTEIMENTCKKLDEDLRKIKESGE